MLDFFFGFQSDHMRLKKTPTNQILDQGVTLLYGYSEDSNTIILW